MTNQDKLKELWLRASLVADLCDMADGAALISACLISYFTGKGSDFEAESPEHKGALAEFSQWFQDEITADYGGINCEDIIGTNAAKRVEYCPQIIAATYEKCVEILQNRGLL